MNQYEFEMINKRTGKHEQARCTGRSAVRAFAAVTEKYGSQYTIATSPMVARAPHAIVGEIDCSQE